MSQNPGARLLGIQPQLPLPDTEPDDAPHAPDPDRARADEDRDWRLDEHTREVGRRGITAARACLRSSAGRAA